MNLGFVGLGNMGYPMALNLVNAGHRLTVYNRSSEAVQKIVEAGAIAAASLPEVARAGQIVFTSLPTPAAVESVYIGDGGLIEGAQPEQLFIDLSTISPALAKDLALRFAEKGATVLDAPVSGGVTGARAATLAVMVGGDIEAFSRAEPVLRTIGKNIFHVGPVGSSSTIKILNQLLVGITNLAVAEMINVAQRAGMDMNLVEEVIKASSGWSRVFETAFPRAMARDFDTGFAIDLMAKDLRLAQDLGKGLGTELPMAERALSIFEKAAQAGMGRRDVSAALQIYEK
ncbi:MAG: NAD(P)-dependent oxidoreductase [Bacteroidetes bacterium]|nr:NAD(P)-dependent oxidoreductase [Bacteroidota bacterium]